MGNNFAGKAALLKTPIISGFLMIVAAIVILAVEELLAGLAEAVRLGRLVGLLANKLIFQKPKLGKK